MISYSVLQVEDESYQLRPMNCPFHVLAYKHAKYSYRDLPLRWAELGTVYRYERSGTMHGLFRVRGFTQVRHLHAYITIAFLRVTKLVEGLGIAPHRGSAVFCSGAFCLLGILV